MIGNLPQQVFCADVFSEREYQVIIDFAPEFDLTGAKVEVFEQVRSIATITPVVAGQQMTVTYSAPKDLPPVTQHYVSLGSGIYFGWSLSVSTRFARGMQESTTISVVVGEGGEPVMIQVTNNQLISELESAFSGSSSKLTYAQFRAQAHTNSVIRLKNGFAAYLPNDATSADNGTTILVDTSGRRYQIMTAEQLFNQILTATNIFDIA